MPSAVFSSSGRQSGGLRGPGLPQSTAPTAAASASADPSYLAYLRGVGVEEAQLNNVLGTRVGAIVRGIGRQLPAYADQRQRAVEGAGQAAEGRGFFRSGARMLNQTRAGLDVDRDRMNYEAEQRDRIAELYGTNALDVARLRRELTEQGINGAQNVSINNANAGIYT